MTRTKTQPFNQGFTLQKALEDQPKGPHFANVLTLILVVNM